MTKAAVAPETPRTYTLADVQGILEAYESKRLKHDLFGIGVMGAVTKVKLLGESPDVASPEFQEAAKDLHDKYYAVGGRF